ncbi:MAG: carboxypeptidase-like regulatory domain-containing protein, partial [Bacteroidota bacterium]
MKNKSVMRFSFFLTLILLVSCNLQAQVMLKGHVYDQQDSTTLPYATLVVNAHLSNSILGYTTSDEEGNYQLKIVEPTQVVNLQVNYLGYKRFTQQIILGDTTGRHVVVNAYLVPDVTELEEIVIQDPIIVKKDTIIYDIASYTEERDQTLEDVLEGMPGIRIRGDGTIEVKGQQVDKVLIDGEEVTDQGAALITRSLSPEDVAAVEVRFDEQNTKIKESLVDTRNYVVLDIKLNEDFDKSLFGKARATIGYQDPDVPLGGYVNLFRLGDKFKAHFFGERDRFGELTIPLEDLKNLGAESRKAIFQNPPDFNELRKRNEFNNEIYGFDNFTLADKNILGLTTKLTLSPKIDLYFGTYNSYTLTGEGRDFEQQYLSADIPSTTFNLRQQVASYDSKSKLDFRFDTPKTKVRFNANAVFFDNNFSSRQSQNQFSEIQEYQFRDRHRTAEHYYNLKAEHLVNQKLGFALNGNYSGIFNNLNRHLNHNDANFAAFFRDEGGQETFTLTQDLNADLENLTLELSARYQLGTSLVRTGIFYDDNTLSEKRIGKNMAISTDIDLLNGQVNRLKNTQSGIFAAFSTNWNSVRFNTDLRYVNSNFPDSEGDMQTQQDFLYELGVEYNLGSFSYLSVKFSKQLTPSPLRSLVRGATLVDFQTLVFPSLTSLPPTDSYVFSVTGAKRFGQLSFEPGILYGRIQNGNIFTTIPEANLIVRTNGLLVSDYALLTLPLSYSFKEVPIDLTLEPEWMRNRLENA